MRLAKFLILCLHHDETVLVRYSMVCCLLVTLGDSVAEL